MRAALFFLSIVLFAVPSHATIFWYGDEVDQQNAIEYANSKPYDAYAPEDFENPEQYNCFSLDAYNAFAAHHPYQGYEQLTSRSIQPDDVQRLGRDDYNKIANENPYDSIQPDDVNDYDDTRCWTLSDYNQFAETKPHDRFKPVFFQDFDDLATVQEIGKDRTHFFAQSDFNRFDLQRTQPRQFVISSQDYYHPSNYPYYSSGRGANYYIPYGAVDFRTINHR